MARNRTQTKVFPDMETDISRLSIAAELCKGNDHKNDRTVTSETIKVTSIVLIPVISLLTLASHSLANTSNLYMNAQEAHSAVQLSFQVSYAYRPVIISVMERSTVLVKSFAHLNGIFF